MSEISETKAAILKAEQKRLDALAEVQRNIKTKNGPVGEQVDKLQRVSNEMGRDLNRMQMAGRQPVEEERPAERQRRHRRQQHRSARQRSRTLRAEIPAQGGRRISSVTEPTPTVYRRGLE
jgi:hypothetical protein